MCVCVCVGGGVSSGLEQQLLNSKVKESVGPSVRDSLVAVTIGTEHEPAYRK